MIRLGFGAVLFDLDGVLADSIANVERHWRAWAARTGLDPEDVLRVVHGRRAVDSIGELAPWLDPAVELARLAEEESTDTEGVLEVPGAAALVGSLPPGRWAVVTSGTRAVATARLRRVGIEPPAVMVAADDVTRGKPDPEGYLAAAARLGVPPERCVVVEDAPPGIAAARAAGMRAVGVATTYPSDQLRAADAVAERLADVRVESRDGSLWMVVG